jgi:hypothetical protein
MSHNNIEYKELIGSTPINGQKKKHLKEVLFKFLKSKT